MEEGGKWEAVRHGSYVSYFVEGGENGESGICQLINLFDFFNCPQSQSARIPVNLILEFFFFIFIL